MSDIGRRDVLEKGFSTDETLPSESELSIPESAAQRGLIRGARVGDHWQLDRLVGGGGMGLVFRAWQEDLARWVAIKFVRPEFAANSMYAALFRKEARAMARCPHRNIVPIHATGSHDGIPFFVMDYVDGTSLDRWIDSAHVHDAQRAETALDYLTQACDALSHLHENGLVHRDVKPSNLLLKGEQLLLTDFGIACDRGELGTDDWVIGSPKYMAPEVAVGNVTPETEPLRDVYALGCVAYELLTGFPVFNADSASGLMRKHLFQEPDCPSRRSPDLPSSFDPVLARALAKDVGDRTPSVKAFREDLVRARATRAEPESILVLDDDEDWGQLMKTLLQKRFANARVDVCQNPRDALVAVDMERYSVIVADLQMPVLSGIDWIKKVRAMKRGADVPIVVVTGSGGAAEWKEANALGVAGLLLKPLNADDLYSVLTRAIRGRTQSLAPTG